VASVDRQRAALLRARQRGIQVEVARAARQRRVVEATGLVRLSQRELAEATAIAERARADLGTALRQLVADVGLDQACASVGLTAREARSLIRFAARH
jgi:hypothetical protein